VPAAINHAKAAASAGLTWRGTSGNASGTLNVTGIVGLGKACEIAQKEMAEEGAAAACVARPLKAQLEAKLDEVVHQWFDGTSSAEHLNMSFAYVEGESLLMGINDIAVSSGSACTSAPWNPATYSKHRRGRRPCSYLHPLRPGAV